MPKSLLTVIIPFLNEKEEVENTIKSLREHSKNEIQIILINDASDDRFNYKYIANRYKTIYIENEERLGVAASRDIGVSLCETPYFLLLDAHMRFYNFAWEERIVDELKNDFRSLLCCQTKTLIKEDGKIISKKSNFPIGSYISLNGKDFLHPRWNFKEFDNVCSETTSIVCVLGAGYACSKEYWQYLKGLSGLIYYGSDEPYISIKVWLEGGSCKLLKDITLGHIYRKTNIPYRTDMKYKIYNRLLIAELLLPEILKKEMLSIAKYLHPEIYSEIHLMLHEKRDIVATLKKHYKTIFNRDFSFFDSMNRVLSENPGQKKLEENKLLQIAEKIFDNLPNNIGLIRGKMGIIVFFFWYGRYKNETKYSLKAEQLLEEVLCNIEPDIHYGLSTGLCGIGWAIEYLAQEGFLDRETNDLLKDFDQKIMEINPERITNLNKENGFGGIVLYILGRLFSNKNSKTSPFDTEYLDSVYNRINKIINLRDKNCDSIDVFLNFKYYYEKTGNLNPLSIYDIYCISNPLDISLNELEVGLNGLSGIGLRFIFEKTSIVKHNRILEMSNLL